MAEGARLESVFRGNSNVGSNPTLSASLFSIVYMYSVLKFSTEEPRCTEVVIFVRHSDSGLLVNMESPG